MSMMNNEIYDALLDAGASQEKAKAAAESVANLDDRFNKIDRELYLIKWIVGFILIVEIIPYLQRFFN